MAAIVLDKNEIRELVRLFRNVFAFTDRLRKRSKLAKWITFPRISQVLSESLLVQLIREGKLLKELHGVIDVTRHGGKQPNIVVRTKTRVYKVEAKATGASAFEAFGKKDLNADYLLWAHFGDFFLQKGKRKIQIYVLRNPGGYYRKPTKLNLQMLQKKVGSKLRLIEIEF